MGYVRKTSSLSKKTTFICALSGFALLLLHLQWEYRPQAVSTNIQVPQDPTQNSTLGFGAILIGVMPHRTDQMDMISLLSHYSGLDITIIPGVDPLKVENVALPPGDFRPKGGHSGHIGCWRSHLNMLKVVVDQKLGSALILEADADWDIRVKAQFRNISANLNGTIDSPYGRGWDSMWLGQCRHISDHTDPEPIAVFADETVAPLNLLRDNFRTDLKGHGVEKDGYRMISKLWGPSCMAGYAVTLDGAIKILYQLGLVSLGGPIDNEICRLVQANLLHGMIVTPPLFSQYKTGTSKDSDIETEVLAVTEENNDRVCLHCVGRSVREELDKMIYPKEPELR